jgi:hypothetical protein
VRPARRTPPPEDESPTEPDEEVRAPRRRRPRPEPGAAALWQGTFGFPWEPSNLRAWILFGIGWSLTALMTAVVWHLTVEYQRADELARNIYFRVLILWWKGVVLFFMWTGLYASGYFLATIQDTAAGHDKTKWPDENFGEKLVNLLYLMWVICWASLPAAPLVLGLRYAALRAGLEVGAGWLVLLVVPWVLVLTFPLLLLATQASQSVMGFWHDGLFRGLLKRPGLVGMFYLASGLLAVPCYVLGVATVFGSEALRRGGLLAARPPEEPPGQPQYYLIPLTGFVCSAAVLIYGRLLGRVGGIVSGQSDPSAKRRR